MRKSVLPAIRTVRAFPRGGSFASARGFSLMEMVAVLLLIAIAVAAVSIQVTKSLTSAKIQAVSRDLVAALRYTRGQAIVKGEQRTLDVDLNNMSYVAPGRDPVKFPAGVEVRMTTAENEVTSDRVARIRFYPDGSSTGGHVSVLAGQREWRVNVEWLTGDVALAQATH